MHRPSLIALSLVVAAAGLLFAAGGETPQARAQESSDLQKAVEQVMTKLSKNTKGLKPGITNAQALKATKGSAHMNGGYTLSLKNTPYAPDGDWHGTVSFFAALDEPRATLENFEVALLCGDYDRKKMVRWLIDVMGPKVGLQFEADADEENLYWDSEAKGRDIWVSFGDGVILLECSFEE